MSNLMTLLNHGQSIWLDYIDRNLVNNGGLQELVGLGVRGMTSNPTIFEKLYRTAMTTTQQSVT